MNNAFETMNEQMKQFTDMQQRGFEPMRAFGAVAVDAFEQVARKNYAVAGDMVDFAIKQASLPLKSEDANEAISTQINESKAFAELMNKRANEYMELADTLGGKFRAANEEAVSALKSA